MLGLKHVLFLSLENSNKSLFASFLLSNYITRFYRTYKNNTPSETAQHMHTAALLAAEKTIYTLLMQTSASALK